jgi:hypothetical protein
LRVEILAETRAESTKTRSTEKSSRRSVLSASRSGNRSP